MINRKQYPIVDARGRKVTTPAAWGERTPELAALAETLLDSQALRDAVETGELSEALFDLLVTAPDGTIERGAAFEFLRTFDPDLVPGARSGGGRIPGGALLGGGWREVERTRDDDAQRGSFGVDRTALLADGDAGPGGFQVIPPWSGRHDNERWLRPPPPQSPRDPQRPSRDPNALDVHRESYEFNTDGNNENTSSYSQPGVQFEHPVERALRLLEEKEEQARLEVLRDEWERSGPQGTSVSGGNDNTNRPPQYGGDTLKPKSGAQTPLDEGGPIGSFALFLMSRFAAPRTAGSGGAGRPRVLPRPDEDVGGRAPPRFELHRGALVGVERRTGVGTALDSGTAADWIRRFVGPPRPGGT